MTYNYKKLLDPKQSRKVFRKMQVCVQTALLLGLYGVANHFEEVSVGNDIMNVSNAPWKHAVSTWNNTTLSEKQLLACFWRQKNT